MALQSKDLLKREYFWLTNDNNDYYKCGVAAKLVSIRFLQIKEKQ
jgi:hypothetical protein